VSVDGGMLDLVEGGVVNILKNNKKLDVGNGLQKNGRRGNSDLLSRLLLPCTVAKVALVAAALGCVCGSRYVGSRGKLIEK